MSTARASKPKDHDLVVAPDGSIPAEQLERLGVSPGTHLRVVAASPPGTLAGSLPQLPDLTWEEFEQASALATHDLTAT